MRTLAVLAALAACDRGGGPSPSDRLWSLAPAGARGGIVISPRGVAMIEAGYLQLRSAFDTVADLAPAKAWLATELAPLGGAGLGLADFGFSPAFGAALFVMKDGMVAILPVADRDKFLAKVKGTKGDLDKIVDTSCKPVRGFYACATAPAVLDTLGQGDLRKHVTHRGDIEVVGAELPYASPPTIVAGAIQLQRGAGTLRATVTNVPSIVADKLSRTATVKIDGQRTAGFALLDLVSWLPKSDEVLVGDVTVAKALATLDGHAQIITPAGVTVMNVEQAVTDPGPLATIVERCAEMPGSELLTAKTIAGTCHFKAPNWDLELALWMDGKKVRIGKKEPPQPRLVPMSPAGGELARGAWSLVFWGRGTMLAAPELAGVDVPDVLPAESAMVIRVMSLVNELGLGVRHEGNKLEIVATLRTMFANPDPVLAKVLAITARDIAATRAAALADPIAKASPGTPFAHDFAAGHAGLLVPTALVGTGTSLIVPALMLLRQEPIPKSYEPLVPVQPPAPDAQ